MKNTLLLLTASALLFSCKKDSENNPSPIPTNSACILTEVRDSSNNQLKVAFEFDASRRISKIKNYSNGNLSGYNNFTYNGSTIITKAFNDSDTQIGSSTIFLNSSGYFQQIRGSRLESVNGILGQGQDSIIITYNASGQLLTYTGHYWMIFENDSLGGKDVRSTTFEYSSGRLSKINLVVTRPNNPSYYETSTTNYVYNENSPMVTSNPVTGFFSVAGNSWLGKLCSDKIPVSATYTSSFIAGGSGSTQNYTYSSIVDSKGNPTKIRTFSDYGGGFTDLRTSLYTYSCP